MCVTKRMGPVTLHHSPFGSVLLGVLVVGAGATPGNWTIAPPPGPERSGSTTQAELEHASVSAPAWRAVRVVPNLILPTRAPPAPTPALADLSVSVKTSSVDTSEKSQIAIATPPEPAGIESQAQLTPLPAAAPLQPALTEPFSSPAVPDENPAATPVSGMAASVGNAPVSLTSVAPLAPVAAESELTVATAPGVPIPPPPLLAGVTRFDLAKLPQAKLPQGAPPPRLAAKPQQVRQGPAAIARAKSRAPADRYRMTQRGIEFDIAVSIEGAPGARVPVLIDASDTISVRLADLLGAVRPLMDEPTFAQLNAAGAAQEYVTFGTLRKAGIDLRYDAARDRLTIAAADGHA